MRKWVVLILCIIFSASAQAQVTAPQPSKTDPLGRGTPRSTLVNFLREMQAGNVSTAVEYLELRGRNPRSETVKDFANKLFAVLNQSAEIDLRRVSDAAEGTVTDGLPADEERLGVVPTGNSEVDIILRRDILIGGASNKQI